MSPVQTATWGPPCVHLVDDEAVVRDALAFMLHMHDMPVSTYDSGPALLAAHAIAPLAGCLLVDVRMDPMSGLQLQQELVERGVKTPLIFLTGHGDIPMAVDALQRGAFDFVVKPPDEHDLLLRLRRAMDVDQTRRNHEQQEALMAQRLASLNERERAVMRLVVAGKMNKVIADQLGVSIRTVEVHRSRVFEKLGVRSAAEAATLLALNPPT